MAAVFVYIYCAPPGPLAEKKIGRTEERGGVTEGREAGKRRREGRVSIRGLTRFFGGG